MMAVLIVIGMFMDWVRTLLLTMPIFVPIVENLGYDPVWFGVLFCMNMQISYLSPPFWPGRLLKSVAPPEISLQDIFRALWPFMLMQLLAMVLVIMFGTSRCGCRGPWRGRVAVARPPPQDQIHHARRTSGLPGQDSDRRHPRMKVRLSRLAGPGSRCV